MITIMHYWQFNNAVKPGTNGTVSTVAHIVMLVHTLQHTYVLTFTACNINSSVGSCYLCAPCHMYTQCASSVSTFQVLVMYTKRILLYLKGSRLIPEHVRVGWSRNNRSIRADSCAVAVYKHSQLWSAHPLFFHKSSTRFETTLQPLHRFICVPSLRFNYYNYVAQTLVYSIHT